MKGLGPISRAIAIATLMCFAAPQAEAIEAYGAGTAATQLDDGLIVQVRGGRGGGTHRGGGGMHRGGGNASRGRHASWSESRRRQPRRLRAPGKFPRRELLRQSQHQPKRELQRQPECELQRQPERLPQRQSQCLPRGPLGQLGAAGRVLVADRRGRRGRRGAWLCERGGRSVMGGRGSRSEPLLVLYRREPPARLLGRVPIRRKPAALTLARRASRARTGPA